MRRLLFAATIAAGAVLLVIVPLASAGPPSVSIDATPANPTTTTSATFGFSSPTALTFDCDLDGAGFSPCTTGQTYPGPLGDGSHTFTVKATDATPETNTASFTWIVDTTPPSVPTISSGPAGPTNDVTPAFGFSSSVTTNFCSIDDATPSTSCNGSFTASTLGEGPHTFYVTAADALGNTSAAATRSFTVDTTPPSVPTISSGPAGPTNDVTPTFGFGSAGATTFNCSIDDPTPNTACNGGTFTATTLGDGPHTFYVTAADAAGNTSAAANRAFTVDTTPPVLTGPGNLSVEADGSSGTKVAFTVSGSDGGLALLSGAISCVPISNTRFPLGSTTVTCTAADAVLNVGTLTFVVTVRDSTAPSINAPDASFTATDASGIARTDPAVASYLAGISASDLVSGTTLTTTTPDRLPIGITKIVVTARDATGNQSQKNVTLTVLEPGKKAPPPDFTAPGPVRNAKASAGDGKIVLTWARPTAADLKSIRIVRTTVGSDAKTTVFTGLANTFTNRGLKNGVAYRFELVALDKAGNSSPPVVVSATPDAVLLALPKPGTRVTKPPLLRWAPVPSAKYFNVQLYRGKTKVFSAWPTVAKLQLKARWSYDKRRYTLKPGTYTWYVWPGVGPRSAAVYGQLLGTSRFVVTIPRV